MSGGGRVETSAPALTSRCGYDCEMPANRLLVVLLLAACSSACVVDALDRGMASRSGIMDGVASLGGRRLGRAQLGGQIGVGFGDRGNRGAGHGEDVYVGGADCVGSAKKSIAYWAATMEPFASTVSSIL